MKANLNPQRYERALVVTMDGACELLTRVLKEEPPTYAGEKGPMSDRWTPKQRRWFFWALNSGKIQVPYQRTGKLVQSWWHKIHRGGSYIEGTIGNLRPYLKWVQWQPTQAWIHEGRWGTVQGAVATQTKYIHALFEQAIHRLVTR